MAERNHEKIRRRRFTRRLLMLGAAQVGLFGILGWRLRQLQVLEAPKYSLLAEENRINIQLLPPSRGLIFDRFGKPLATNTERMRVFLVPELSKDIPDSLDRLNQVVPVSQRTSVPGVAHLLISAVGIGIAARVESRIEISVSRAGRRSTFQLLSMTH